MSTIYPTWENNCMGNHLLLPDKKPDYVCDHIQCFTTFDPKPKIKCNMAFYDIKIGCCYIKPNNLIMSTCGFAGYYYNKDDDREAIYISMPKTDTTEYMLNYDTPKLYKQKEETDPIEVEFMFNFKPFEKTENCTTLILDRRSFTKTSRLINPIIVILY